MDYYFDILLLELETVMPTHFSGTPAETRALDTFIKLTRCTNALLSRLAKRATIDDLTPSRFAVLEALYHLGTMTQGEISRKVLKSFAGGDRRMMTQNLAALVRYRIEQADEALDAARILLREGSLRASVNRS